MGARTIEESLEAIDTIVQELVILVKDSSLSDQEKSELMNKLFAIDSDMHLEQSLAKMSERLESLFIERYEEIVVKIRNEIYNKLGRQEQI